MATGRAGAGASVWGDRYWGVGGFAGILGAVVYGGVQVLVGEVPVSAVAPYDILATLLWPGAIAGMAYAIIVGMTPLDSLAADPPAAVLLGVGFGCLVWLATPLIGAATFGNLTACGMFGIVVGLVYAAVGA